jgi:hypothetical protein
MHVYNKLWSNSPPSPSLFFIFIWLFLCDRIKSGHVTLISEHCKQHASLGSSETIFSILPVLVIIQSFCLPLVNTDRCLEEQSMVSSVISQRTILKNEIKPGMVAQDCHPSYVRGRDWEDCSSRPFWARKKLGMVVSACHSCRKMTGKKRIVIQACLGKKWDPTSKISRAKRAGGWTQALEHRASAKPWVQTPVPPRKN